MIQPPSKNPSPKPASNLRGMRMVILSLAVMTVGGGMVLFVYALSKAQDAMSKPKPICEMQALTLPVGGEIVSVTASPKLVDVAVKQTDGILLMQLDRCSGEEISRQALRSAK